MKFLVDAHLPRRLCAVLVQHGHDAVHTVELPAKNATKDQVIDQTSLDDQRVVISKDTDFFYSHVLHGRPWKLLLVRTGNISMRDLCAQQRLADGWTYGPRRDDSAKKHPCLVPYEELPESEKEYDRHAALGTLKAILALGYRIEAENRE